MIFFKVETIKITKVDIIFGSIQTYLNLFHRAFRDSIGYAARA